jgi:hypothetical protein
MDWPDLCRTQAGVITRAQLLERGLTESALLGLIKRRALIRMHPGVYSPRPVPGSFAQRAWAGALWSGGVLSHRSAAQMHGLPVPRSRLIHVTVPREVHRSVAGVKLHRTSSNPYRPVSMDGLPVTSRTVTIVELLRGEPARVARDLFDRSVQQGWLSGDDLSGAIVHEPGRAGNAQLRRLIAMYEAGAQAQSERILTTCCAEPISPDGYCSTGCSSRPDSRTSTSGSLSTCSPSRWTGGVVMTISRTDSRVTASGKTS